MKCTSALRQLVYDTIPNAIYEYLQMGQKPSRLCLEIFCINVMEIFGPVYLQKHTITDVVKLFGIHEQKLG